MQNATGGTGSSLSVHLSRRSQRSRQKSRKRHKPMSHRNVPIDELYHYTSVAIKTLNCVETITITLICAIDLGDVGQIVDAAVAVVFRHFNPDNITFDANMANAGGFCGGPLGSRRLCGAFAQDASAACLFQVSRRHVQSWESGICFATAMVARVQILRLAMGIMFYLHPTPYKLPNS